MPGGVFVKPPEHVRAAVQRQIPKLQIDQFDRIAAFYNIDRNHRREPTAKVRASLQSIAEEAGALWLRLRSLSEEAGDELFMAALKAGQPTLVEKTDFALRMLMGIGRNAALDVGEASAGAPAGARREMVRSLANLLEGVGIRADARPTGELVFLVRSVLESYGEVVKDPRKLVADALETIARN